MSGQWTGQVEGASPGLGVLELDDFGLEIRGIAYHFPDDSRLPGCTVRFSLPNRDRKQIVEGATLTPLNPNNGFLLGSTDLHEQYPNTEIGQTADHPSSSIRMAMLFSLTRQPSLAGEENYTKASPVPRQHSKRIPT